MDRGGDAGTHRGVKYSVVVPVFNEEASIVPLYEKLKTVMGGLGEPWEAIFVDDGSSDRTGAILDDLSRNDPSHLRVIRFDDNRGQTRAMKAGFNAVEGEVVVSMDGDLQNDPADIPLLLGKLGEGYGAVCGWRHPRNDPLSKRVVTRLGCLFQRLLTRSDIHDMSCTLRAYDRKVLKGLRLERKGYHRFIPYLLMLRGVRVGEVKVHHHPRIYGEAKYGLERVLEVPREFLRIYFRRGE